MTYLHVPFCRSFCTYCDFYSEICPAARQRQNADSFAGAVLREIEERREEIVRTQAVDTLYIGGGTPSVLPLDVLESIVSALSASVDCFLDRAPFAEFTVEVNPEDVVEKGIEYVRGLADLGVNRISMGVQSFDDGILRWMNRRHDAETAVRAFRILREGGVGNISIDLIFGLSQLSDQTWVSTIERTLELNPEHISAYQLSIEEGSALAGLVEKGCYEEASEEQCRTQYDNLCRKLSEGGYRHYEVSNFARPGREAVHNSAYWNRSDYVGLGPGAHSLIGNVRSRNTESVSGYSREEEILTPEDIRVERIMLPLRTAEGIPFEELCSLSEPRTIDRLLREGALDVFCSASERDVPSGSKRIRIPENHFFVSDEIIRELI